MTLLLKEEVAELLMEASDVRAQMEAKGVFGRRGDATVPLGTITNAQLIRIVRGVMLLVLDTYPQMVHPEVVEELIRSAAVREAGGSVN